MMRFKLLQKPWNYIGPVFVDCKNCKTKFSSAHRKEAVFCSRKCHGIWRSKNMVGKKGCNYRGTEKDMACNICKKSFKRVVSAINSERGNFCSRLCYGKWQRIIPLTHIDLVDQIRGCYLYRQWKSDILTRDNHKCILCGDCTTQLNIDHINPLSLILQKYEITCIEQAESCSELWNINNGRTLCFECHKGTKTYGGKIHNYRRIQ